MTAPRRTSPSTRTEDRTPDGTPERNPDRTPRATRGAARPGVPTPRDHRASRGTAAPVDHRPLVRVRVTGDLDLGTAPRLAERVLDLVRCGASVAVDTSGVAFVDCCGLAALERCVAAGRGDVAVEPVGDAVARLRALVALSSGSVPTRS